MRLRAAKHADIDGINRLHRSVWWSERSETGWKWVQAHPGLREMQAPWGWILADDQDRPVAFVGNLVQRLHEGANTSWVATGFSIIVPPSQRGSARLLIRAVLDQPGVAGAYTLNANHLSSRLYPRHGMRPWPEATHALKLSWVVDHFATLSGRVWREVVTRLPDSGLHLRERLVNRRLVRVTEPRLRGGIEPLQDFGDRSDYRIFWQDLQATGLPLTDRSPETMRWFRSDPDRTLPPLALADRRDGTIVGVLHAQMSKGSSIEPPILDIVDITALPHAPDAPFRLVQALLDNARAMGAAKVRLQVVGPTLLEALGPLIGTARKEGGWGHGHAWFRDPGLAQRWSPTPFDGDYGLCLRPVPLSTRASLSHRARTPDTDRTTV